MNSLNATRILLALSQFFLNQLDDLAKYSMNLKIIIYQPNPIKTSRNPTMAGQSIYNYFITMVCTFSFEHFVRC